jgi:hypothetical protein
VNDNPYCPPEIPSDPPEPPAIPSPGFGWSGNLRVDASMVALFVGLSGALTLVIVRLLTR